MDQYDHDMLVLFQCVARVGNQYPEIVKAQMFVQGLQPDLSLAVGPFMSSMIQKAIEKAQMCELTFARGVAACGPASIYNMVTNPVTTQFPVPQMTLCCRYLSCGNFYYSNFEQPNRADGFFVKESSFCSGK